jgi:hypothetical protein
MEVPQWIVIGLIPAIVSTLGCGLAGLIAGRWSISPPENRIVNHRFATVRIAAVVAGCGWAMAVAVGLLGQRMIAGDQSAWWWPEDFWQRGWLGTIAAAILLGGSRAAVHRDNGSDRSGRWILAALISFATATIGLPSGDGWEDTQSLHRGWLLLLGTSGLVSMWSLDRMAHVHPDAVTTARWLPLVILAMLGGPLFVAATTYSALTHWTLSAIVATVVCGLFAAFGRGTSMVATLYPASMFLVVMMSAGRFYSYEDHSWWTYLGFLGVAPAVVCGDWFVTSRQTPLRTRIRVIAAATIAVTLLVCSILLQLTQTEN